MERAAQAVVAELKSHNLSFAVRVEDPPRLAPVFGESLYAERIAAAVLREASRHRANAAAAAPGVANDD